MYIAGGAVVRGWLSTYRNRDIKILGRGIIMPDNNQGRPTGPLFEECGGGRYHHHTDAVGGSDSVRISNCKVLSWYGWGDGFNVFASSHVSYEHIFARTSDDCSTIYCTRKDYQGSSRHIRVKDAVYWADVAHPIMIGLHGDIEKNEVVDDVRYEDTTFWSRPRPRSTIRAASASTTATIFWCATSPSRTYASRVSGRA